MVQALESRLQVINRLIISFLPSTWGQESFQSIKKELALSNLIRYLTFLEISYLQHRMLVVIDKIVNFETP